ncbi:TonB-dependent receptor [Mucilaginibacter sp. RS28]|uniref:TonB-dependent receptor n=1 Tax=Mucilaginibacter straminoryzae TaxID=2932774 RepID=A0A9X2B9Z6_9SPHI|nr:outer membrane beta-barrel protein [Mucilaginibacter straminoryzae]MCJ8210270.1 TonB-dependent receptor [Mucilaginibacter straminoryzae]
MKLFLITFIYSCISIICFAQHPGTVTIKGMVRDSATHKPVDYASISLIAQNNNPVKATYTLANGAFKLTAPSQASYNLTISFIGFRKKTIDINAAEHDQDLGMIDLVPDQKQLKEVNVKSYRPLVKQEADRISYDLQADPESKASTVLDMLRKVPYITVDADQQIKLKGNSDYKIYINNKPSGMISNNPVAVLKSMPASTIQRIEVITNPSSKYDAEGVSGIINIITVKKRFDGYNGSININESFPAGGPGAGGSLNVKAGKLGISLYTGGGLSNTPEVANSYNRNATGAIKSNLNQNGTLANNSRNGYLGTELSYEADSLNLISLQFNTSGNHNHTKDNRISALYQDAGLTQGYHLFNDGIQTGSGADISLNYQLGSKKDKNRLLTLSAQYSNYNNSQNNAIGFDNRFQFTNPDYRQYNKGTTKEKTLQADYIYPLKKLTIEAGAKAIFRDNSSDFTTDTLQAQSGNYVRNNALNDSYSNKQTITALYNTYRYSSKSLNVSGGLRLEHTNTDIDFTSTATTIHQNYFNLVPNVSFNKDFKTSSVNFGYSMRINRPGINRLNPFVDRSNPNVESSGNPDLKASSINSINIGYNTQTKLAVTAGMNYIFVNNLALQVWTFDPTTNITKITYENLGKGGGVTGNLNLRYPVSDHIRTSFNGNASYVSLQGTSNGQFIKNARLSLDFYGSVAYKIKDDFQPYVNLQYSGPNQTSLQGHTNRLFSVSVGTSKDLIKNKLSLSAYVNNPFTKMRNKQTFTEGPGFTETTTREEYFRSVRVSLNYNFGKLKDRIRKTEKGIKNDDLDN